MKTRKRVGDMPPPPPPPYPLVGRGGGGRGGRPCFGSCTLLWWFRIGTLALFFSRFWLIQVCVRSATPQWCNFNLKPSFHVSQDSQGMFLFLAVVFCLLCEVGDLIGLYKGSVFLVDESSCFKVPHETSVKVASCKLPHATGQSDRTVAVSHCLFFPLLVHRRHDDFLSCLWHSS